MMLYEDKIELNPMGSG